MEYHVKINKRAKKDIHIYRITKKISGNTNLVTRLFMRIFVGKKKEEY